MKDFIVTEFYKHSRFAENFAPSQENIRHWELLSNRYDEWLHRIEPLTTPIPKIIHQIWIGSELPAQYRELGLSWKEKHPGWDYILWDNEKILSLNPFPAREVYLKAKSYGVKSDIARYEILRQFGGIYADTDFECVKSFEPLIHKSSFFAGVIFGNEPGLCNALIGTIPNHSIIVKMCSETSRKLIKTTELMDIIELTGPGLITRTFFQDIDNLPVSDVALPSQYFYSFPNFAKHDGITQKEIHSFSTNETHAIHYWEVSWSKVDFVSWVVRKWNRLLRKLRIKMHKMLHFIHIH